MNIVFPEIKEGKAVQYPLPLTCNFCGESFEGVYFQHKFIAAMSQVDDITNFDIQPKILKYGAKTLLYRCYSQDHPHVCANCIQKLDVWTYKLEFNKTAFGMEGHKYGVPRCPKCNTHYGSDFYIVGHFPPEVLTKRGGSDGGKFIYRLTVEIPVNQFEKQIIPTNRCCLCMSSSVAHVVEQEQIQIRGANNKSFVFQQTLPLCEECFSILGDISSPGSPIEFRIDENIWTMQKNKIRIRFVNPLYGKLWLEENKGFVPTEYVPVSPKK